MSSVLDETAADQPVRDFMVNLSRLTDPPAAPPAGRGRQDVSQLSRVELEDRFLRQQDETLLLRQQLNDREDKIRKLATKLMRLVKDRRRLERLAAGGAPPPPGTRDVEVEEVVEELQEQVRGLQAEKEGLRRRLLLAKQRPPAPQRPAPYRHVPPRVDSGRRRGQNDEEEPADRRRSSRSPEGSRPAAAPLPRFGHSLLEEARDQIRSLEGVTESQRRRLQEVEGECELLREELKKKEAELQEEVLQVQQQTACRLRSQISDNVNLIKLQKQLTERSHTVSELESRFLHLQQSQQTLKDSHKAAMLRVDELSAELREERRKNMELEKHLQTSTITRIRMEQFQQQISELEQERDLLKDNNQKLVNRALDSSLHQGQQLQQQLRLQISELESDLQKKNQMVEQMEAERDTRLQLEEEKLQLQLQLEEQSQQLEELRARLKGSVRDVEEQSEALLLIKSRASRSSSALSFLLREEQEEQEQQEVRRLRAAHTESIQELEKTRKLLTVERRISEGYQAELKATSEKMEAVKAELEEKLERQAKLLDSRAARIRKLEAQLRNVSYGGTTSTSRAAVPGGGQAEDVDESSVLDGDERLLELQVVGATLSPAARRALGDPDASTFCTYAFYRFQLHATPVARGPEPRYGATSRYAVRPDRRFLDYLRRSRLTVALHRADGPDWRTVAGGRLALRQLLEPDGELRDSVELQGSSGDSPYWGSLEVWIRISPPMTETGSAHSVSPALAEPAQSSPSAGLNQLLVSVLGCSGLGSGGSRQPSAFVVYRFWTFEARPTQTVPDCGAPRFDDRRCFPVCVDGELRAYLRSERLLFFVFDDRDERPDRYLGRAGVPLRPLLRGQTLTGEFPLTDASGRHAGLIQVSLQWTLPYAPPPHCRQGGEGEEEEEGEEEQQEEQQQEEEPEVQEEQEDLDTLLRAEQLLPASIASQPDAAEQVNEQLTSDPPKEAAASKKVTFMEPQLDSGSRRGAADEDESQVSEGQLVAASDESEVSEDLPEDANETDSDDCIVLKHATGRKRSDRLRVEIVSLTLRAESRVSRDDSVVRLFVEFSLLDLPTEETPLSLPKPPPGRSANYNYSKVVPVDAQTNMARRRLLRGVLQGRNPSMERIRFTVVSEPPEEEEQERECEDVGVASLRLSELLERRSDVTEESLDVVSVAPGGELLGSLTVSLEALEALQSIMEDQQDQQDQQDGVTV
ncbi:protein fantom [Salarias fasciatus]|uniref:protein fantom n=1 Tax=Salarias fasciatus TaxID=181472 RepID=UPI001176B313|nr:protein fantom-like [Salarias fasciatus]XP_029952066.1 protein fantom-like [Salarias fasciatus]